MVPYSGKLRETLRDARLGSESRGGTLTITNIDNLVVLRWEERKQ